MAQSFEQNSELDRMKADAIKRARQMHLRATNLPPSHSTEKENNATDNPPQNAPRINGLSQNGILEMIRVLGFENDQIILIALILILSSQKENFPLLLALLYIAL